LEVSHFESLEDVQKKSDDNIDRTSYETFLEVFPYDGETLECVYKIRMPVL